MEGRRLQDLFFGLNIVSLKSKSAFSPPPSTYFLKFGWSNLNFFAHHPHTSLRICSNQVMPKSCFMRL